MSQKLTLTIEGKTIESAKKYAQKRGVSLSALIEEYLKMMVRHEKKPDKPELSDKVKRLLGSVKLPKNFEYKTELKKSLSRKYKA